MEQLLDGWQYKPWEENILMYSSIFIGQDMEHLLDQKTLSDIPYSYSQNSQDSRELVESIQGLLE